MTKKKIKDLCRFEVFLWPEFLDKQFIYIGNNEFQLLNSDDKYYFLEEYDFDKEVEVLGKMVLTQE